MDTYVKKDRGRRKDREVEQATHQIRSALCLAAQRLELCHNLLRLSQLGVEPSHDRLLGSAHLI